MIHINYIKRKLILDFDGTSTNDEKRICELYNAEFKGHKGFKKARWELETKWNFTSQCPLATKEDIQRYFDSDKYFIGLSFFDGAKEAIRKLCDKFDVYIVSMGWDNNLKNKDIFIKEQLPYDLRFIPINFKDASDKSRFDMSCGIIVDDNEKYLNTSNAQIKICYGEMKDWNRHWTGKRCLDWNELYNYLLDIFYGDD